MLFGSRLQCFVAVSMLVGACSSATGASTSAPGGSSDVVLLPAAAVVARNEEQQRVIHDARQTLLRDCMVERGFEYPVSPFVPNDSGQSDWSIDGRYGLADLARAREYGYRRTQEEIDADREIAARIAAEESAITDAYGDAYRSALIGTPVETDDENIVPDDTSCMARTATALRGSPAESWDLETRVYEIFSQAHNEALASGDAVAAIQEWSACMSDAGFQLSGSDPLEDVTSSFSMPEDGGGVPSELEINTAVADVRCKESTNLVERLWQAEAAAQHNAIEAHQAEFIAYDELRQNTLEQAKAILENN